MPVDRGHAESLARTMAEIYGGTAERLEWEISRRLAADIDHVDSDGWQSRRRESLRRLEATAQQLVDEVDDQMSGEVDRVVTTAAQRGSTNALRDLEALGYDVPRRADARQEVIGSPAVTRLAASLRDTLRNTHLRVTRVVPDIYREVTTRASADILLGTQTRRQVGQRVFDDFVSRGISGFVDRAGRSWTLESYTEMATRTIAAQAAVESHLDRLESAGLDLVIVSDSPRECRRCRPWEGRVLSRGGSGGSRTVQREHATRDGETVSVDVAGSVDEAIAAGLLHPRCTHSLSGYFPGVTDRGAVVADDQPTTPESEPPTWDERAAQAATGAAARQAAPSSLVRDPAPADERRASQLAALRNYQDQAYEDINAALRAGTADDLAGALRDDISEMDAALRESPLRSDVVTLRGVDADGAQAIFGEQIGDSLTGAEWVEASYASTTTDTETAEEFAQAATSGALLMRLLTPEGVGAIELSSEAYEAEVLLERGLSMRVVSDSGPDTTPRRIDVEVIP